MDVIELECPHCGDALELDAAFAGGVCRCSTCGTLMTVPADPSRDRAETVTRRERPDMPGGARPDTPGARPDTPGARPDVPGARPDVPGARPDTPGARPESPGAIPAAARADLPPAAALPADDDTYVTASGKSLKLAEAVVPTARKRKKVIRATVYGAFAAFVLVIVGVIVLAIMLLMNTGKNKDGQAPTMVGVDPNVNPIKKPEPNILGIPIAKESAIVVQATSFARQWYPWLREIINHEVSLSSATDYMIIPWTDLNPKSFPGKKPEKIGRDKLSELDRFLNVSNVGTSSPAAFVELALEQRSDQVIIITGRPLEEAELNAIREAVSKRVDTRIDAIIIGGTDEALKEFAEANNGKYIAVTTEQLEKWYQDWKKGEAK